MSDCHLYKLPNELLLSILAPLPTPQLLPLTVISQRIYALVLRILHNRLVAASNLQSHSLLLECYHPSAKLTEPPYFCTYLGTDGLSEFDPSFENGSHLIGRLREMRNMYSRFRPYRRELDNGGRRVKSPPGDIPGSRTFAGDVSDRYDGETVKQTLFIDENELFTQLVAQCSLAKYGPGHAFPTNFVEVEEGVIRVHRKWLKIKAANNECVSAPNINAGAGNSKGREAVWEATPEERSSCEDEDAEIKWVKEQNKNTGLRLNVKERKLRRDAPILIRVDELDAPVSYEIEYDELLIRTSHLVLMLEESLLQEDNSGKAVVFGSFG